MKVRSLCRLFIAGLLFSAILVSCTPFHEAGRSGKVPPGQAKKMHGQQSARDYAPGHNK